MTGIIKLVILLSFENRRRYIFVVHTRVAVVICLPTCYVFAALAMLIRVIGSDRAVNTIWYRKARLKPVRLYNMTIVIRFGCLSSFQNCLNNLDVVRIGLAIVVCLPVCLRFGAPSHVKIAKYNCVPFLPIRHRTLVCFWYDFSTRAESMPVDL